MTNTFSKAFFTAFLLAATLSITSMLVVGCKDNSVEPQATQEYDSEAAADMQASSLGTESGGAGVSFSDVMSLTTSGTIPGTTFDPKSLTPMSRDTSYDPTTGQHTVVVTRTKTSGKFSYNGLITYIYTFFDASGNFTKDFVKGSTDKITVTVSKQKTKEYGDRLDVEDTATGSWTITNIISGIPILNGTYNRNGESTFHTASNGDRTFTHSMTMNFVGDTLIEKNDGSLKHSFLKGPANSHFTATTSKGTNIVRDTKITFNGDGTATLEITRTSGDGSVDTYTIDTKVGLWLRKGR